jgi:hypothetical protein
MNTVKSADYQAVQAESFELLVDAKPKYPAKPAIGILVTPHEGEQFMMPVTFRAAKHLATMILKTLLAEAPELFR